MQYTTASIIRIYQAAQFNLIKTIAEKEARGNVIQYQRSLLSQVNAQLVTLDRQSKVWADGAMPLYYQTGLGQTNAALRKMGVKVETSAFSLLHTRAVGVLAFNTYGQFHDANVFVGRQINDIIRQVGIEVIGEKVATGATVKEAKKQITQRLIDEGFNGIRDKRGRTISLESYANVVARSTTREATNTATLNQLGYLGYDLVKMSDHASPCPICAPLEGRVYSISGNDPRYPALDIAHGGGYANIHPNCQHVLTPYIEELAKDPDKDRVFSNRTFDTDPRSQREINAYNSAQKEKRLLRADRDQYERYKLAMPDEISTFSAFRRMKNADSDRWNELQGEYRSIRQIR